MDFFYTSGGVPVHTVVAGRRPTGGNISRFHISNNGVPRMILCLGEAFGKSEQVQRGHFQKSESDIFVPRIHNLCFAAIAVH